MREVNIIIFCKNINKWFLNLNKKGEDFMKKAYFKAEDNTNEIAFPTTLSYFERLEKEDKNFEHNTSEEMLEYQKMALNNVLDFARKNNKFYRERNQNLSFSELNM